MATIIAGNFFMISKFISRLSAGLCLLAAVGHAQFSNSYPGVITGTNAFGGNYPGSVSSTNIFSTNRPASIAYSSACGTNAPGVAGVGSPFIGHPGRLYVVTASTNAVITTNLIGVIVTNSDAYLNGYYYSTNASPGTNYIVGGLFQNYFVGPRTNLVLAQSGVSAVWEIGTNNPVKYTFPYLCSYYSATDSSGVGLGYPVTTSWSNGSGYTNGTYYAIGTSQFPTIIPVFSYTTNITPAVLTNYGITVSGAGSTNVNGNYSYTNSGGYAPTYVNGTNRIYQVNGDGFWYLASGAILAYDSYNGGDLSPLVSYSGWVVYSGIAPAPSLAWNSNSVTLITNVSITYTTNYP